MTLDDSAAGLLRVPLPDPAKWQLVASCVVCRVGKHSNCGRHLCHRGSTGSLGAPKLCWKRSWEASSSGIPFDCLMPGDSAAGGTRVETPGTHPDFTSDGLMSGISHEIGPR